MTMSVFAFTKPCRCGAPPVLCNIGGAVYFEPSCDAPACKAIQPQPVRQGVGAADRAREMWNRSVG